MVEMVVCSIMLATVSLVLVPAIHGAGQQRKAIRFETLAMIELGNIRQRLLTTGLAGDNANQLDATTALSDWYTRRFPTSKLELTPVSGSPETDDAAVGGIRPVRLTIHQPAGPNKPDWGVSVVVWISEDTK